MDERNVQRIKAHLQSEDAQERIRQNIQRGRSEVTVTIGRAARLFNFSENKLRDWEDRGLLKPLRSKDVTGQRQYSPAELDKLAVIKELIDEGYTPSEIPTDIDNIWYAISSSNEQQSLSLRDNGAKSEHLHIDQRVERANKEVFWRYFVSQVLRLSLMLICEDIPDTVAGLVLPLEKKDASDMVRDPGDLPDLGESLVGWISLNRSFYAFLDAAPSFLYPTDFRVHCLQAMEKNVPRSDIPKDNTYIVVQREAKPLTLSSSVVETIRCLLALLYGNVQEWRSCFGPGMRDWPYQATDFINSPNPSDDVLNDLADIVVRLGGQTVDGKERWSFSCVLLPKDATLPVQQQNLVVRAQSKHAPHNIAVTTVSAKDPGLSLRAYLSGHIIYRPDTSMKDFMVAHHEQEESTRSAVAIPIPGENGLAIAVLYIASNEAHAFPEEVQRVLRVVSKMVEELLLTYRARLQVMGRLTDLISNPGVVDTSFKEFLSENEFISDLEDLLTHIHTHGITAQLPGEEVSLIAIDIDNQAGLARKYGDQVARNLSQAVGLRIQRQPGLLAKVEYSRLYHVNAGRFYFLLRGIPLDEARNRAETLRKNLEGEYRIDARGASMGSPISREDMLSLPNVTVRLGVHSYKYEKLKELLGRYPPRTAITSVCGVMSFDLDTVLARGQRVGGNVVISWDPNIWGFIRWSPEE